MRFDPQEQLDEVRRNEPGLGAPAGVFLMDGEFHVAALESRAARRLHAMGALLVAAVRFDPPAARALHGGSREGTPPLRVRPLQAPKDLPRLGPPPRPN